MLGLSSTAVWTAASADSEQLTEMQDEMLGDAVVSQDDEKTFLFSNQVLCQGVEKK